MNTTNPQQGSLLPCHSNIILKGASSLVAFLFLFTFFFFPSSVFSIEVGGHITEDTTWVPDNNPYYVTGNIFVDSGVTLTISPGTLIEIGSARQLNLSDYYQFELNGEESIAKMFWVNGRIIAEGTEEDSIIFKRDQDIQYYRWGTILLSEESGDLSMFKYCKIEFTYQIFDVNNFDLYTGAICANNGKLKLENCLIQNVEDNGITLENPMYSVLIKNNIFKTIEEPSTGLVEYIDILVYEPFIYSMPLIVSNT